MVNQLDIMKNIFEIQSPQLNVMYVANSKTFLGSSSLVETPQTSTSLWTLRQNRREIRSLRSDQNMSTTSDAENISNSNRLATIAQTNSIEGSHNSNKITHSKNTSDIYLSEGDDGIDVDDTLTTSSKGALTTAQFIDRNANTDLGKMLCHKTENFDSYSRKPKNSSKAGRKIFNRHLDITNKSKKTKPSKQRISKRDRGTSRQKLLKRKTKQIKKFVAMSSMAKNVHKYKYTRHSKTAEYFLESFSNLSMIDGQQSNDTHPLTYTTVG